MGRSGRAPQKFREDTPCELRQRQIPTSRRRPSQRVACAHDFTSLPWLRATARRTAGVALQTRPVANQCEGAALAARVPFKTLQPRLLDRRGAGIEYRLIHGNGADAAAMLGRGQATTAIAVSFAASVAALDHAQARTYVRQSLAGEVSS